MQERVVSFLILFGNTQGMDMICLATLKTWYPLTLPCTLKY